MSALVLDLTAARAARAEAAEEFITVTFNKHKFTIARDIPYVVVRRLGKGDIDGAIEALLGKDNADALLDDPDVTLADITALIEGVTTLSTGSSVGESSGSSGS